MMDRKGRTIVGLISPKKPFYYLLTHIPGKSGEYQINPQLPKEVLRALGESRRQTIEKEIGRVSEGVIENKKIAEDTTKDQTERNKAREREQRQISSRVDLQKQKSGFSEYHELPKIPEDLLTELPSLSTTTFAAEGEIDKEFPNADKNKIKFIMDRKGRTRVGLISPKKPYYNLLTQIPGKSGEYRVNSQLPKQVLRTLGESRQQTI